MERSPSSSSSNPGAARVGQGPVPRDVVGVIRHRRPGVPVGRDVAVAIQVVEQHELFGQLVMVGRDLAAEHHQRRIAVAARHVAEDLIVGAILLDDVQHILDRRRLADLGRNGRLLGVGGVGEQLVGIRAVLVDRLGIRGQGLVVGDGNDRQRARERGADVGVRQRPASVPAASIPPCASAFGRLCVGLALVCSPLPTPIKSCLPSGVTATAVGYQPGGDESLDLAAAGRWRCR